MVTKVHHLPPLPGAGDLYRLLEIVNNKDRYSKVLTELEEKRREVNESFENQYKASQIDALFSQAKADRGQAKAVLDKANEKSTEILKDAASYRTRAMADVDAEDLRIQGARKSLEQFRVDLNNRESELNKAIEKHEKESDKKEKSLSSKVLAADKMRKELKEKTDKLNQTLAGL